MKIVTWTDKRGYTRRAMLRDSDPEDMPEVGVPMDPPDLNQLDWDDLVRQLHNELAAKGIVTWKDVQYHQNGVTASIQKVLKRPIIQLYRNGGN